MLLPAILLCSAAALCAAPDTAGRAIDVDKVDADKVDADAILALLARPPPSRTGFVEVRDSALLKAPLRIAGEYRRPDAGTLVREVRAPYPETTTIRAGEVSIERAGKSTRHFSLARVPELAALQASFGALLAGDRQQLERHYTLASDGSRRHWTLRLTPRDATMAARVQAIVLHGRGAELRCIETVPATGEPQLTLLAGAARAATAITDGSALAALCRAVK